MSRGGEKLQGALDVFNMNDFSGKICADVGASTGGFTDCMLQHGAKKVYAIDVGYGILHWKMRNDERVICMERTNARYIEKLDDEIDFISIDVSFISLDTILPVSKNWLNKETGEIIALVKPQFEAGKEISAKGKGVIRDPAVHKSVLTKTITTAIANGLRIKGLTQSPILGQREIKNFFYTVALFLGNSRILESLYEKHWYLLNRKTKNNFRSKESRVYFIRL